MYVLFLVLMLNLTSSRIITKFSSANNKRFAPFFIGIYEADSAVYLVFEYLPLLTLQEFCQTVKQTLSPLEICKIIRNLLKGIFPHLPISYELCSYF